MPAPVAPVAATPAPIPTVRPAPSVAPTVGPAPATGPDARPAADVKKPRRRRSVALRVALRVLIAAWIGLMALLAVAYLPGSGGGLLSLRTTLPASGIPIPDPLIPMNR